MLINIQHEETGRLKEWPLSKPLPHGWARVSEPFEAGPMARPELKAEQCLKEMIQWHCEPMSSEYNQCEKPGGECMWCSNARAAIEEIHGMTDMIQDLVAQGCNTSEGEVDSCAISTYADAMRWLASIGRFEITHNRHRRVIGRWPTKKSAHEEIREDREEWDK